MTHPSRLALAAAVVVLSGIVACCASTGEDRQTQALATKPANAPIALPSTGDTAPRDYPGIHNAVAFHEGFVSGSVPEGDAGFDTLQGMGVKTIISVDGAEPEVDKAQARGIRYIHLPIGYNGFDEQRKLELARATSDAMKDGPVYIHCHHGKHRSAGAAATIAVSLGWESPEQAVERMKVSGTAPNYKGLYACASSATMISATAMSAVPANFPSVAKPPGFVRGMVEIDEVYDHLKAIEKAGWKTPADHPDLVPVAEAGRLADLFLLMADDIYADKKPADFSENLRKDGAVSQRIEDMLASNSQNAAALSAQFKLLSASCKDCHAVHRD